MHRSLQFLGHGLEEIKMPSATPLSLRGVGAGVLDLTALLLATVAVSPQNDSIAVSASMRNAGTLRQEHHQ